ncbi:hypothetical protein L8P91_13480 [Enterobacter bugandensis]|uniref:hypothetical protein n=1 Tax=Enterobacter bugandensis TaxID=881260 RepID=UPI002002E5FF|nr:hypothetical protein [Enterobacter bugandensis]MCK7067196.1 hypothetical protein [Enterobacter bugandensis]
MDMRNKIRIAAASILGVPLMASAHVKWFVDFDTTKAPESLGQMAGTLDFWALLIFSIAVVFATSVLDRKIPSFTDRPQFNEWLDKSHNAVPVIMRWGTGTFFLILGFFYPHVILTPELLIENPWLKYIHYAIAVTAFSRRTSIIAGFGILFLYSYAVQLYGVFHMLDYFIFIGTGVYLITQTILSRRAYGMELELLRFVLCYSFLWGAVEKFMQPDLFYQLLEDHSYLAMGLDWEFYVRACGFVELCLAWHIYTGKLAGYASIGVLATIVVLAFIPFGLTDFIGHFLFMIPLVAVSLTPRKTFIFRTAMTSTVGFIMVSIALLLFGYMSYYVLHFNLHPHLHP